MSRADAASPAAVPAIERLLQGVIEAAAAQAEMARRFVHSGVNEAHVPNEETRFAFGCLGDHDRASVLSQAQAYWPALSERALVRGEATAYSTPVLRLLLNMAPQLMAVADLDTQLDTGPFAVPPTSMFKAVVRNPHPIWGDPVRIELEVSGVDYLRIEADRVFGREAVLCHLDGQTQKRFLEVPGDDGTIVFTMRGTDGQLYGDSVELRKQRLSTPRGART